LLQNEISGRGESYFEGEASAETAVEQILSTPPSPKWGSDWGVKCSQRSPASPNRTPSWLGIGSSSVCPTGADYQWGKDPLEQLMVRFDSYRAVSPGNQASRNLVTKSTSGGRATLQAVTRVKLEQASKAIMWTPTRPTIGEGRANWEEPGAGARYSITVRTSWATGVVSTALQGR
jgi:hypothetical protein